MAGQTEFVADTAAGISPAAKKPDDSSKHAGDGSAFGGEGGSSFAHLTEVGSEVRVDSVATVLVGAAAESHTYMRQGALNIYPADDVDESDLWNSSFLLTRVNDSYPRFTVTSDGSLHWGDGTAAPSRHLVPDADGGLALQTGTDDYSFRLNFNDGHAEFWATAESDAEPKMYVSMDDGSLHWGDGTNPPNVSLVPAGPGVLSLAEHGSGLKMFSAGGDNILLTATAVGGFPVLFSDYANQPVALTIPGSAAASTLGTVVKKYQVFDAEGTSLGYVPVYDAIT